MSRVQSIERAFAVLGALADGPIGVTEVADRADLPKSTAARLLASLAREGVVEQVPGDTRYRLGPRLVTLAARIRPARSLAALARPSLAELADDGRRGGRAERPRRRLRPLHRAGRQPEPGLGPRLDRLADPAPRGLVRAGPAGLLATDVRPALPRPPDGAVHRRGRWSPPMRCSSGCGRSGATATPGRSRSSTRASRRSRRPSPTRRARSSPRSTSTARRTASRSPGAEAALADQVVADRGPDLREPAPGRLRTAGCACRTPRRPVLVDQRLGIELGAAEDEPDGLDRHRRRSSRGGAGSTS